MITLTYRKEVRWRSEHVTEFQDRLVEYLRRLTVSYRSVWVLETTEVGKPHYHVLVWVPRALLPGRKLPMPDERGWWPHGSTRIEWCRNAIGYLVKYASKGQRQGKFPKGSRLFGIRGLQGTFRRSHRLHMLPLWVKQKVGADCLAKRLPAGGWWVSEHGELFQSPVELDAHGPNWVWISFRPRGAIASSNPLSNGDR